MRLKGAIQGPARQINSTDAIVVGSTSGYESTVALGPLVCIEDTTFESDCVVLGDDSSFKPLTGVTYGAGTIVWAYFTTLHLASGSVQAPDLRGEVNLDY